MDNNYNTYIELDTLLDTRYPVAHAINPTIATTFLSSGHYHNRVKDNIGIISQDIFYSYYNNRNKHVLSLAYPTEAFDLLQEVSTEQRGKMTELDITDTHNVYINIYPYVLSTLEQKNIKALLEDYLIYSDIIVVSMNNEELTPVWLANNVSLVIKYDTLPWMELHMANQNLLNKPLLEISFYTPFLTTGTIPSKDINNELFSNMRVVANHVVNLTFIATSIFCMKRPKK